MKLKIYAVGKLKKAYFQEASDDYLSRIKHYSNIELIETTEEGIKKFINDENFNIVLDVSGEIIDSLEFSKFLENLLSRGQKNIAFFIGGSEGLQKEIIEKANFRMSFSRLTFPHELARVMLLEQIYRAFTIIKNEKYHK